MHELGKVELNGDIPKYLKLIMLFIDRVGFPVLAFLLMFYISYCSIAKMTAAISESTNVIREFRLVSEDFQKQVAVDHIDLRTSLKELQKYSYGYQDHLQGRR